MSAQEITVKTIHDEIIDYTMIKTVEELEEFFQTSSFFCEYDNIVEIINNGEIILVNRMGGWCTFKEDYYTIVPDTIINYDDETTAEELAEAIADYVANDEATWEMAERSPEPYRFMIYESGIVENPLEIAGTPFYDELVEALKIAY